MLHIKSQKNDIPYSFKNTLMELIFARTNFGEKSQIQKILNFGEIFWRMIRKNFSILSYIELFRRKYGLF